MRYPVVAAALLALILPACGTAPPEAEAVPTAEEAAVLATIDRFFAAMEARDQEAFAAVLVPEAMTFSQRIGPAGPGPLRARSNQEHIDGLAVGTEVLRERIWDPVVMVHPPVATVWAPYDFWIDDAFSHCGVDSFQLFKVDGEWKLTNISWTVETEGCEPSPLGPLRSRTGTGGS